MSGSNRRYRVQRYNGWHRQFLPVAVFAAIMGFVMIDYRDVATPQAFAALTDTDCRIKGNISLNTGEKIFHTPGQEHYTETRISPGKGERWFCSEAEARQAGWRKAKK